MERATKISKHNTVGMLVLLFLAVASSHGRYLLMDPPQAVSDGTMLGNQMARGFSARVAVLQNFTLDTMTMLTILEPKNQSWNFQIVDFSGQMKTSEIEVKKTQINGAFDIVELKIDGLESARMYYLQILGPQGEILDTREFQSLDTKKADPVIAVASCARVGWLGHDFGPRSIWDELLDQKPDVLLFLGDMVYPDTAWQALLAIKPTDEEIENRYTEAWQENRLYHQFRLTPVFAVMDDHDYGFQGANSKNNGDRQRRMLDFFRTFYPIPDSTIGKIFDRDLGAAFRVELFGFQVFMLDNKYARSASGETNGAGTIWGRRQLEWLGDHLSASPLQSMIGSGTLFTFPIQNEDAAEFEAPSEFSSLQTQLLRSQKPFILMSGDVHYSAVHRLPKSKYQFSSYEVISSRIHSISPLIIPPFISGYLGPEYGQAIHTAEKNFVIFRPHQGQLQGMGVEIHRKGDPEVLSTSLDFELPVSVPTGQPSTSQ